MDYLYAAGNLLLDVPTSTVIAAVFVAFAVALMTAKVSQWVGRREANGDATSMATVILLGNIVSMAVAAGYVSHLEHGTERSRRSMSLYSAQRYQDHARSDGFRSPFAPPSMGPWARAERLEERYLTEQILKRADTNHDGQLSAEESSRLMESVMPRTDSVKRPAPDARIVHS